MVRASGSAGMPVGPMVNLVGGRGELFDEGRKQLPSGGVGDGQFAEAGEQPGCPATAIRGERGFHTSGDSSASHTARAGPPAARAASTMAHDTLIGHLRKRSTGDPEAEARVRRYSEAGQSTVGTTVGRAARTAGKATAARSAADCVRGAFRGVG